MASSHNEKPKNVSPLAALAPLHALAQLVPAASPKTGSKHKDEGTYILLTSLKPDAWLVHVGHPDGRWWNGSWREADMKDLAVCIDSPPLPTSRIVADEVYFRALVEWRSVLRARRSILSACCSDYCPA